ncbi:uncharacterized protein THITE_2117584 [Thermothielavioides terrestris NRRL 8126]|uniref:Carboxylic ester hydrolase n=1 Tax=Thermothielavioides terrestris (strain ATCC 38088 / NRRL 8126) TaxID=578455 RepID=G2R8A7_THETT|nr:uncharacterized protein THITE_2117584 [Thermothielavioides terrestris NRRL 8126]AEO68166.1 hypothetical protein THITE_2117584 [Thermothielavioides terrestris NRRL 8126]
MGHPLTCASLPSPVFTTPIFSMAASLSAACVPSTFTGLSFFGASVLSLEASLVANYSASVPAELRFTQPAIDVHGATFCNVTVSYTHPGQNDNIIVETWLPVENPSWNGRLQAVGGSGWDAGRVPVSYQGMAGAIGDGYATTTTDAGLGANPDPSRVALASPGNINWYTLTNFASVALNDQAVIGKALVARFYGRPPSFSYWNGCSQGGRQGVMLAQRYPRAYDGIAAGAPVLWTSRVGLALFWPQQVMHLLGAYPRGCEVDALSAAEGKALWHGLDPGADLVTQGSGPFVIPGVAATDCSSGICVGVPSSLALLWMTQYLARGDPSFNPLNLTHAEFDDLLHLGRQLFRSAVDTDDPDLSRFRDAGGKMVTFHGLADGEVASKSTRQYYQEVEALVPDVHKFYRHFEVPGLGHCSGKSSGQPASLFEQLRAWVESGVAPEQTPVNVTVLGGAVQSRILCPYPQVAKFDNARCRDRVDVSCWSCSSGPSRGWSGHFWARLARSYFG